MKVFGYEIKKFDSSVTTINKETYKHLVQPNPYESRPDLDFRDVLGDEEAHVKIQPVEYDALMEVSKHQDTLRTIHINLNREIFRNGGEVKEKFVKKCMNEECEAEFKFDVEECPHCKGKEFREPEIKEKRQFEDFIKSVNDNKQTLIKLSKSVNQDIESTDDGWMHMVSEYLWKDNKLVGSMPVELIRVDPRVIQFISDKKGRPGRSIDGTKVFFCLNHRKQSFKGEEATHCPDCGKELQPAHYRTLDRDGHSYYSGDEIHHESKYFPTLTNGFSPIYAAWFKVQTLMGQDKYISTYYNKQRSPKGLLFVNVLNRGTFEKAWGWMRDQFKLNPHIVPPIMIENPNGQKGKIVEFVDFMRSLDEMQFTQQRDEFCRKIGVLYGCQPIFQADLSQGGGLNNEGLEVTLTNRALEEGQIVYNTGFYPWLADRLGIKDWEYILNPSEEKDNAALEDLNQKKIMNAQQMQIMGFDVKLKNSDDAEILKFEYGPVDKEVQPEPNLENPSSPPAKNPFSSSPNTSAHLQGSPEGAVKGVKGSSDFQ